MRKLLIINPFGIGDVMFTTPVIRNIKSAFPDSFIGYWCNERVGSLLKDNADIDRVFALSRGDIKSIYRRSVTLGIKRSLKLFLQLRKERFDTALDYSLDHRYTLVAKFAGIKKRVGFNYRNRGRFLTRSFPLISYSQKHVIEYYLELLKFIDVLPRQNEMVLGFSDRERQRVSDMLAGYGVSREDRVVGVAPGAGASWGKDASRKHWPAASFARLIDMLIEKFGVKVILLGDATERPIADQVCASLQHKVIDLVGKTSIEELIALIKRLKILVTNDGGPLHMAVALGTNTVSIFGPVDPKVYGPYPTDARKHIVLTNSLECTPCYNNFRLPGCDHNSACVKGITAKTVFDAVAGLLSGKESRQN